MKLVVAASLATAALSACYISNDPDCCTEEPRELELRGASATFGDGIERPGIAAVALGGTQTLRLYEYNEDAEPIGDTQVVDPWEPVVSSFRASIDNGNVSLDEVTPPELLVSGIDLGWDTLHISDLAGDELHAEQLQTRQIARAQLQARAGAGAGEPPWALLVGGPRTLGIALYDDAGNRLVDEELVLEIDGGAEALAWERVAWDALSMSRDVPGEVTVVAFDAASNTFTTEPVTFVDTIDDIVAPEAFELQYVDDLDEWCLEAWSGDRLVRQAPWSFEASGAIEIFRNDAVNDSCLALRGDRVGTGQLTVTIGELSETFVMSVVEAP